MAKTVCESSMFSHLKITDSLGFAGFEILRFSQGHLSPFVNLSLYSVIKLRPKLLHCFVWI